MTKWTIHAIYSIGKHVGDVEAETEEEALRVADDTLEIEEDIGLCRQCAREAGGEPTLTSTIADKQERRDDG